MKRTFFLVLLSTLFYLRVYSQNILTNFIENQDTTWGSVSAEKPNYGFYGQEFTFAKNVVINSFSCFIIDHPKYDETQATVNFAVWSFNKKPIQELYLSPAQTIQSSELKNWKTYAFPKPIKLKKGTYLFAVGQSEIQGFVGFGGTVAKKGYENTFWMKSSMEGSFDGKTWHSNSEMAVILKLSEEEKKILSSSVNMMKIDYK